MTVMPTQATSGPPAMTALVPLIVPNPDTSEGVPPFIILSYTVASFSAAARGTANIITNIYPDPDRGVIIVVFEDGSTGEFSVPVSLPAPLVGTVAATEDPLTLLVTPHVGSPYEVTLVTDSALEVSAYSPTANDQLLLTGLTIGAVNYVIRDMVALETANANYTSITNLEDALSVLSDLVKTGPGREAISALQALLADMHLEDHNWQLATGDVGLHAFAVGASYGSQNVLNWNYIPNLSGTWESAHNLMARLPNGADPADYRVVLKHSSGANEIFYLAHAGNSGYTVISEQDAIVDPAHDYYLLAVFGGLTSVSTVRLEYDNSHGTTVYYGDLGAGVVTLASLAPEVVARLNPSS